MQATEPTITVAHLSDTHFVGDADPEGTFAYDTAEAFAAIAAAIADENAAATSIDLVAVTGDVADHGTASQYREAAEAFAQLDLPVAVCPGNHDRHVDFMAGISGLAVSAPRALQLGNWCFLFVDSNAGVLVGDAMGRLVDPPDYHDRLASNGALGDHEIAAIKDLAAATDAAHLFIWVHHPPDPPVGLCADEAYAAEWRELAAALPRLRGIGAGHTHVPQSYDFDQIPVHVAPSLKNNFDLETRVVLPPGWARFDFHPDGRIDHELKLVDDPRWPRVPYGRAVHSLMVGELSFAEFDAIVARKQAAD